MGNVKYYLSKSWIKSIIIFVISLIAMITIALISNRVPIIAYCDASFVVGAILIAVGLLSFVTFYGVFDIFGYSSSYVFNGMKKGSNQKYKDFHDYIEKKTEKRAKNKYNFIPYVCIGFIYILIAIILFLFI